jgi:hypothetical protein
MEKEGIIRRSNSTWSSPLHMVRKPDGSWRPCDDYRRLNMVTVADSYPLPNILDFQERIAGCTFFSRVDLRKGYHQILMHPVDIPKTANSTPFGLFEFLRMTFRVGRLMTSPAHHSELATGVPLCNQFLPPVHPRRRSHPQATHQSAEGRTQARSQHTMDRGDAGSLYGGQGRLRPAFTPPSWSRDFSAGGRFSGPHWRRPATEGPPGSSMETSGIFLMKAGCCPGQIFCF